MKIFDLCIYFIHNFDKYLILLHFEFIILNLVLLMVIYFNLSFPLSHHVQISPRHGAAALVIIIIHITSHLHSVVYIA